MLCSVLSERVNAYLQLFVSSGLRMIWIAAVLCGCSKTETKTIPPLAESQVTPAIASSATAAAGLIATSPPQIREAPPSQATSRRPAASISPRVLEQKYLLADSNVETRMELIQEFGGIETRESVEALARLFGRERREELRLEMMGAISNMEGVAILELKLSFFAAAAGSTQPRLLRDVAITLLAEMDDSRVPDLLRDLRSDPDADIRSMAAEALREIAQ